MKRLLNGAPPVSVDILEISRELGKTATETYFLLKEVYGN